MKRFGTIDPEITERLVTLRQAIRKGATAGSTVIAGLAMASVPVALAARSKDVFVYTAADVAVLNFALQLDIFKRIQSRPRHQLIDGAERSVCVVRSQVPAAAVAALQVSQNTKRRTLRFFPRTARRTH